jgi:hypothetical protein
VLGRDGRDNDHVPQPLTRPAIAQRAIAGIRNHCVV